MQDRKTKMERMRFVEGKSLKEIGEQQKPPISHQRVQQILGTTLHFKVKHVDWKCPVCKKTSRVPPNEVKTKKFCSPKCKINGSKYCMRYSDDPAEYVRRQGKWHYRNTPGRKERMQARAKERWDNEPGYKEKRIAQMREYQKRIHAKK